MKKVDHYNFFTIYKMSATNHYQKSRDVILDRAKDYYKSDIERLRDNARDKYRNLSEEEEKNNKKTKIKRISKKLFLANKSRKS